MMRTIEILLVIVIMMGGFIIASFFAVLPQPSQVSPLNLRRLSLTTLQMLDVNYSLSETVFRLPNDPAWNQLQVALSASLPPNIVYNLTVYQVLAGGTQLYIPMKSISNAQSLGVGSDSSTYFATSSNVTFNAVPEKIGSHGGGGTLYILNCNDTNGWWITGYTTQSLAQDLCYLLSPYFQRTIMVQSTAQLAQILAGTSLQGENIQNAVVINTCGEAVPIPTAYCTTPYSNDAYAYYAYFLGQKVNQYNWTWVSIVGYPFYYVSNTGYFNGPNDQNGWGVFGMKCVAAAGLNSFLRGLKGVGYVTDTVGWITLGNPPATPASVQVQLSSSALGFTNYYGIYPSPYQTATRAVPSTIQGGYNLSATGFIFASVNAGGNTWIAGATFEHKNINGQITGKLMPIGLTRTPDIRITALGILSYYQPRLYNSNYTTTGTSRLVVLQLGQVGGV